MTEKPLDILYVVHGYKPAYRIGGPITSVAAVAEGLVQAGHKVTVYTTNWDLNQLLDVQTNRRVDVNGVGVHYFEFREPLKAALPWLDYVARAHNYLYSPAMKRQMREDIGLFDLVHTHLPFIYPTRLAGRESIRANVPLFYHQRGVFDPERLKFRSLKKNLYLKHVELPVLRRANTLFALTEAEVANYRLLGLDTPCAVVPNGINAEEFRGEPDRNILASMGINENDQLVLFLSRIHPTKGAERLLFAFARIAARVQNAKLVLAGPDDFRLKERLENLVRAQGLEGRVIMPGMVTGETKRSLLSRADLFALPSDAEGFSIAILEALASGTAALISPGCHFEEVQAANAGRIVGLDIDAIAQAMLELLTNPDQLRRSGENAKRLVREHYSWAGVVRKTEAAYRDGLARHASRRRLEGI
jgi:glycosyltransferase involved in cell wall biosynthesis